jgi:hypothetical protein
MALRVAVASGNWSNPAIWNGGVLPAVGDIVASNTFTVTIDQNINVDVLTNTAQAIVNAVPQMTSPTTPSGIVTASTAETGTFAAWNAFGGDFNTEWRPGAAAWIAYEFTSPKAINQYIVGAYGITATSWTFEGWNGSSWVVLHTVTSTNSDYTSPALGNTTAYIKYRLNYSTDPARLHTIIFYEGLGLQPATAGGTFTLNNGVTVTCTNTTKGLVGQNTANLRLITYTGTGSATINANILYQNNQSGCNDIYFNGIGTLNLIGSFKTNVTSFQNAILKDGNGVLNITGSCEIVFGYCTALRSNGGTVNINGDSTITFCSGNGGILIQVYQTTLNYTGNMYLYNCTDRGTIYVLYSANNSTVTITGSLVAQDPPTQTGTDNFVVYSTSGYCKVIGSMSALYNRNRCYFSTNASAINILTGPFISAPTGTQPIYVARMHYQRTMGSYYEFRDNSTNGALPPAGAAPATRLVSPDTIVDAPIPANVRQGIVYASGSQTGTMIVPSPSNVANNVPVDNTLGTAVLDPNAIWAVPLTSINTLNSIGRRVKNAATVETTGAQIQQTLNNNE